MDTYLLSPDQGQAWAALRSRLVVEDAWLAPALFRAVPVSTPTLATVEVDRWGRLYVDFTLETTLGMAGWADLVRRRLLDWLSGELLERIWYRSPGDPEFPAVGVADAQRAARKVATALAHQPAPAWGEDRWAPWRAWAQRSAGMAPVSWRDQLAACVRAQVASEFGFRSRSFARLSRRSQPHLVTPGWRAPTTRVGILVDISGSLAQDGPTLAREVARIAAEMGVSAVTTVTADDEVVARYTHVDAVDFTPRPDHGTDLRPGLVELDQAYPSNDVVVVLTDGLTPWPDESPAVPVVVALIGNTHQVARVQSTLPDWVTVVVIDIGL